MLSNTVSAENIQDIQAYINGITNQDKLFDLSVNGTLY